jgi:thiol-disulfide isomerase/thioredoxin
MYKLPFFIFFTVFAFINISEAKVFGKAPNSRQVTFNNASNQKIGFYFYTRYYDIVEFYIEPGNNYTVVMDEPFWLTQLSKLQTPYYISLEADTINIRSGNKGIALLLPNKVTQTTEVNELASFAFVSERMPKDENQILFDILRENNYGAINKIIVDRYNKNKSLFLQYKELHRISPKFEILANDMMLLNLFHYQLFFIADAKKKLSIPSKYRTYMDSVAHVLLSGSLNIACGYPVYVLDYSMFIYLCKQKYGPQVTSDFIHSSAIKEIENQNVLDKVLFFVDKNELTKNPGKYDQPGQEFIEKFKNQEYRDYITSMIEDRKLTASFLQKDELLTSERTKADLKQVLKDNFGKVIYIDLWASWCAPCREQMPASEKLRELYKNKLVAFIFISQDVILGSWKRACEQEKLDQLKANYLMVDFQKSNFKKEYNITTIPRYILIDKNGHIANANAPRPSDPATKEAIDSLLVE